MTGPCRSTLFVALAFGTILRAAHGADAPSTDAASGVAALVRGLEATSAAKRAEAAEALGGQYPEAARAVPVLLAAVHDEDATVRAAALRALRRLGRAGQAQIAAALLGLPPALDRAFESCLWTTRAIGTAVTTTDLYVGYLGSVERGREAIRPTLLSLPLALPDRTADVFAPEASIALTIAMPWLDSTDDELRRVAAAVVCVAGRAWVARRRTAVDDDASLDEATGSAPSLPRLLRDGRPWVRVAGLRLLEIGGPHALPSARAVSDALASLPADAFDDAGVVALPGDLDPTTRPLRISRQEVVRALARFGADARTLWETGQRRWWPLAEDERQDLDLVGDHVELVEAEWRRTANALLREPTESDAHDDRVAHEQRWNARRLSRFGDDPRIARIAAPDLPAIFTAARRTLARFDDWTRPFDPAGPPDDVPADPPMRSGAGLPTNADERQGLSLLALAWIALRAPPRDGDEPVRTTAATILRRALLVPGATRARQVAAQCIADLDRAGLVPATTILASLQGPHSRAEPHVEAALLRALAAVGDVPPSAVGLLGTRAAPQPRRREAYDAATRRRYAAGWPHVVPVLEAGEVGPHRARVRLAAIDALGAVSGERSESMAIVAALSADPDARVRYRAARALRRLRR